jgi:predicted TIM-barrel fold metal-dependent hydrolase
VSDFDPSSSNDSPLNQSGQPNPLTRRSFMLGVPAALAAGSLALPAAAQSPSSADADATATGSPPFAGRPWKVAFEEHYLTPHFDVDQPGGTKLENLPVVHRNLLDVDAGRIEQMDRAGIQYAILSLNSPALQAETDPQAAVRQATFANDELKRIIERHPKRLGGFAALPMQNPAAAADELERCVRQLGFPAPLVNSFTNIRNENTVQYLDEPQFYPFWERVQDLGVPFYLHPRNPPLSQQLMFRDHPELLAATWAFLVESSTHALRLITSGLFDRYPRLQICLGHLGEALPFYAWRLTHVYEGRVPNSKLKKDISGYLSSNFHYTTSGFFDTEATLAVARQVGIERVHFSTDFPWMDMVEGGTWLDHAQMSEADKLRIGRDNAIDLFKLKLDQPA